MRRMSWRWRLLNYVLDKGRDMSAWLGLVPREHSTGGKQRLLGISERGNKYLRTLLIHGARAALPYLEKLLDQGAQKGLEPPEEQGEVVAGGGQDPSRLFTDDEFAQRSPADISDHLF